MLADETNLEVPLTLAQPYESVPGRRTPASIQIDSDSDSSFTPPNWIWLMLAFGNQDHEPCEEWFKVTYEEAERMYDRLGLLIGKTKPITGDSPGSIQAILWIAARLESGS